MCADRCPPGKKRLARGQVEKRYALHQGRDDRSKKGDGLYGEVAAPSSDSINQFHISTTNT
jgi:hypothetical protein